MSDGYRKVIEARYGPGGMTIGLLWDDAKQLQPEGWNLSLTQIHGEKTGTFYSADSMPGVALEEPVGTGITVMGDSEAEVLTELIEKLTALTR